MAETPPHTRRTHTRRNSEIDLDLGFGNVVSSQSRRRLLNRDGTFNVRRTAAPASATCSTATQTTAC